MVVQRDHRRVPTAQLAGSVIKKELVVAKTATQAKQLLILVQRQRRRVWVQTSGSTESQTSVTDATESGSTESQTAADGHSHGEGGSHDHSHSTSQGSVAGGGSTLGTSKKLAVELTISGLSYEELNKDTASKDLLTTKLKDSILSSLPDEYTKEHINITYSKGSVKAHVVVTPVVFGNVSALKEFVTENKAALQDVALQKVKELPKILDLLETGVKVEELTVVSSDLQVVVVTVTDPNPESPGTTGNKTVVLKPDEVGGSAGFLISAFVLLLCSIVLSE